MTKCSIWAGELRREGCKPTYKKKKKKNEFFFLYDSVFDYLTVFICPTVTLIHLCIFLWSNV